MNYKRILAKVALGFLNDKNITQTTSSNKTIIETEITTAEMLLWLARYNIDIIHASFKDICSSGEYVIVKVWQDSTVTPYKGKTLDEAVKRAYDWAIKEERNV